MTIDFDQIDIVVADMDATLAFYRALGLEISDDAIWRTSTGIHHVDITMPSGLIVHFDSPQLAVVYNRGWSPPTGSATRNVFSFKVAERDDVDALHRKLADRIPPAGQRAPTSDVQAALGQRPPRSTCGDQPTGSLSISVRAVGIGPLLLVPSPRM
jgi:catechol 2,3-dioxygenase-like lactoylglutathione lyase family enzyme